MFFSNGESPVTRRYQCRQPFESKLYRIYPIATGVPCMSASRQNHGADHTGSVPEYGDTFSPPEAVGLRASATEGGQMSKRTKRIRKRTKQRLASHAKRLKR